MGVVALRTDLGTEQEEKPDAIHQHHRSVIENVRELLAESNMSGPCQVLLTGRI
jgi:hypothetical protein